MIKHVAYEIKRHVTKNQSMDSSRAPIVLTCFFVFQLKFPDILTFFNAVFLQFSKF